MIRHRLPIAASRRTNRDAAEQVYSHMLSAAICNQLANKPDRIEIEGIGDFEELDQVKPPLPPLVLGDERLRSAKTACENGLRELGPLADVDQP